MITVAVLTLSHLLLSAIKTSNHQTMIIGSVLMHRIFSTALPDVPLIEVAQKKMQF